MKKSNPCDILRTAVRDVPDFPKPGILFRDITPVLSDAATFRLAISEMMECCRGKDIQAIAAIDARGFIFGSVMAHEMSIPFVPIRKRGKLPFNKVFATYQLEYGSAEIEMHEDAIRPGERVAVVDDLLATGGTARAAIELIQRLQGEVVHAQFLIELEALKGRDVLAPVPVISVLKY